MKKKDLIDDLIENSCCWDEEDREVLNGLSDKKLIEHHKGMLQNDRAELVANAAIKGFTDPGGNGHIYNEETGEWESKLVENPGKVPPQFLKGKKKAVAPGEEEEEEKPATTNEWLDKAPPEVRSAVKNAMAIEKREKEAIVEKMTVNVEGKEKTAMVEQLMTEPLAKLQMLVNMLPKPQEEEHIQNFEGASGFSGTRRGDFDEGGFLAVPTMNWDDEEKQDKKDKELVA